MRMRAGLARFWNPVDSCIGIYFWRALALLALVATISLRRLVEELEVVTVDIAMRSRRQPPCTVTTRRTSRRLYKGKVSE